MTLLVLLLLHLILAGAPGFEPRKSGLESDGLPVSLRPKNYYRFQIVIIDELCEVSRLLIHALQLPSELKVLNHIGTVGELID